MKHLSNHTIKHTSPSKHPKHIIKPAPNLLALQKNSNVFGSIFLLRKSALHFTTCHHQTSHQPYYQKLQTWLSHVRAVQDHQIIKSSANLSPANIGYVFFASTASPLAMVKTWVSDKMPFDPTKIHWTPRIHVHQILIPFNCRTHLYWANRSIHHLFWTATPYFAWLKPSNRHSPTHYSCYHCYHSYRHYCFTAIIFSPLLLLLLLLLGYHTYS